MDAKRLIVIDDDYQVLGAISDLLRNRNYAVAGQARNLPDALQLTIDIAFDCAVVDMKLFRMDVGPLIERLHKIDIPYVLMTGSFASEIETPWLRDLPYLLKPFGGDALVAAIEYSMAMGASL